MLRSSEFDVLNLYWLGDSTLSISEMAFAVWTLHDQWAFSVLSITHRCPLMAFLVLWITSVCGWLHA